MTYNILFIGGPKDGQRERGNGLFPLICHKVAPQYPSPSLYQDGEIPAVIPREERYYLGANHNSEFFTYLHESIAHKTTYEILWASYPLPLHA